MRSAIAVLLLFTFPALAADRDWAALQSLRPGEKIWIRYTAGGKRYYDKAEMVRYGDDSLIVKLGRKETAIPRADVRRVAVYAGKSRAKGAGYGAIAGGAAGALLYGIAAAATRDDLAISPAIVVAAGALLVAGVGAVVGLAIGATKTQVVYESSVK